jgi:MFS family permease
MRAAVAIFVLQTAGSGVAVYGIPIYIAAFLRSGTVGAAELSLASTGFFVVGAVTGPFFGRFGQRRPNWTMLCAVLGGAAAVSAMAAAPTGPVVIAAFATLGAIFNGGLVVVGTTVLVRVFDGRPTAGMALATSGSSAGGILVSPVLALLLTTHAVVAQSFLVVAAGFLVITCGALALGWRVAGRPAPAAETPAPPVRMWAHWPLVVAFSLVSASQLGAMSYLVATGLARDFAGARLAVSVATAAAVASRWLGSAGIRRLGLHRWTVTSFCAQAVGVALVGVSPASWVLFLGAVLIGQSLGNTILIRSQVIVELFGIDDFARKFAQFQTWTSLGSAAGPLVLGQLYSVTGDYTLAYLALFVLNVVAVPFLLPWWVDPDEPPPARGAGSARRPTRSRSSKPTGRDLMTQTVSELWDPTLDADRLRPDAEVDELLTGAVDLHTHPGPSPFPRRMSILDAATDAATVGFRALVAKSHHHSMQTDILALEQAGLRDVPVTVYGGVALNNTVGGLNPYAVELALRMGGRVVWFPTIASRAHLDFHAHHHSGFPVAGIPLRDNEPISVLDESGQLNAATRDILDVIAAESAIMNCGHLPAEEIDVLIPGALAAGVTRIVVSHPDFIVGADPARIGAWCRMGAHVEHCLAMLVGREPKPEPFARIAEYYRAAGPGRTILSSDLGQKNNPLPVTAYRRMVRVLLDEGLPPADIKAVTGGNAAQLLSA